MPTLPGSLGRSATHLIDFHVAEVGSDVAVTGVGVDLESGVRRQHQCDVTFPPVMVILPSGNFLRSADLDFAIAGLEFQIAAHVLQMHLL